MENIDYSNMPLKELYQHYNITDIDKHPDEKQKILDEIFKREKVEKVLTPHNNLAERGTRLGAAIIDGVIMIIPYLVLMFILLGTVDIFKITYEDIMAFIVIIFFAGQAIYLSINGWLLYKYGQTVGKKLLEIKIVDLNGNVPPLYKTYLLRYLVFTFVGFIPLIGGLFALADPLFIFNNDRRCIHDFAAGTMVVNA